MKNKIVLLIIMNLVLITGLTIYMTVKGVWGEFLGMGENGFAFITACYEDLLPDNEKWFDKSVIRLNKVLPKFELDRDTVVINSVFKVVNQCSKNFRLFLIVPVQFLHVQRHIFWTRTVTPSVIDAAT